MADQQPTPATHGLVPFFNADQALVNRLCSIIDKLDRGKRSELTEAEEHVLQRINKSKEKT